MKHMYKTSVLLCQELFLTLPGYLVTIHQFFRVRYYIDATISPLAMLNDFR